VYPIQRLRKLPLERQGDRLEIPETACGQGWSRRGIATDFPLSGHRSMYGATKLAAELICDEYRAMYGLQIVINRCGVIAGPWQMGKVDQGFVALWAARHVYGGALSYIGFGGDGLQVRDVLHVADLCDLIRVQLADLPRYDGAVFNVGGGRERSVSLLELTRLCAERAGRTIPFSRVEKTTAADVPYYVTDNGAITEASGWAPSRSVSALVDDVFAWLREHRTALEPVLGREAP
jgi:CDP-paratose 2-epimerase